MSELESTRVPVPNFERPPPEPPPPPVKSGKVTVPEILQMRLPPDIKKIFGPAAVPLDPFEVPPAVPVPPVPRATVFAVVFAN